MQTAANSAGRAATSPLPSQPEAEATQGNSSNVTDAQVADLSLFLQSSFDAGSYVSGLLADVDASFETRRNEPQQPACATLKRLTIPSSPTSARKPSISLSPIDDPTDVDANTRRRQQAQEDLDLSLAISRLNLAIEELDRSISTQVNANAPDLLRRTSNLSLMQTGVSETQQGLKSLDEEVSRLRARVHDPFVRVVELQRELKLFDGASELVRRTRGVVGLARRLESQMAALFARKDSGKDSEAEAEDAVVGQVHGRDLSRVALLIVELTSLLDAERLLQQQGETSLLDLKLIQDLMPTIESARKTIIDYMEDMIVRGLRDLSSLMLGSSLQTAFNLRMLPTLVQDLLNDLTEVVKERTAAAFDIDSLAQQLKLPLPSDAPAPTSYSTYRSGRRGNAGSGHDDEYKQQQQQQVWSDSVWKKLESLVVVEMGAVCSKVYLLEKVLKLKSDAESGVNFLDAALEVLGDKPSYTFWLTFAQSLQQQVATACGRSSWLAQLLSVGVKSGSGDGYPKLIRLFQEFFAKISVYTDVQYTATHQSPETVILLKSLGTLEKAYVDKNTGRIAEVLSQAVSSPVGGARRAMVGQEEAEAVVRSITNVLDTTRFDPLLSRAVVGRCTGLLDQFAARIDGAAAKDWALGGDNGAVTQGQIWNAGLVRFAYTLSQGLVSLAADHEGSIQASTPSAAVAARTTNNASTQLNTAAQTITSSTRTSLLHPLLTHVYSTLATTMNKMHVQLAFTHDTRGKAERGVSIDSTSGASAYASSICDTVWQLGDRLLPLYPVEVRTAIAGLVASRVVELFCLHASIVSLPRVEAEVDRIKLRMATDMTEFEFALSQLCGDRAGLSVASAWIADNSTGLIGTQWMKTTKVFRRLVFLSLAEVEQEVQKGQLELSVQLVVLHLVSRTSALEGVIQELLEGRKDKVSAQGKAELVKWLQDTSNEQVLERLRSILPIKGVDEQTERIIERLLRP
ncbi:uncharacterized protein SPSC_04291 [Sporisorium scitamineum]|uniref:Conserved oligomeric Golgi complex subunit 5 n=1 Tax=Sporisorium scitamineum TaxID=49012 RepID=A0A0F7RYN2_9BASI|nr:uncharacterized protein SPSC_04291 [Sporisorium scitamineum]CDS00209.1 hypothetical protein [Sporisorium scitamineum]